MSKLLQLQSQIKVPKGQYNDFGKYKYRSCEDILEAAKPILAELGMTLVLNDEVVNIGDRYYVKAQAILRGTQFPNDMSEYVVTAYAREDETRKGMDGSQITGSASSYARKYALNGLFLIDDTKDADATNDHGKGEPEKKEPPKQPAPPPAPPAPETPAEPKPRTAAQAKTINEIVELIGLSDKDRDRYIAEWIPNRGKMLTLFEAKTVIEKLRELQKSLEGDK